MVSVNEAFGSTVRRRRRSLGLSQEELADRAGLHRTYVSLIERGLRGATIETIVKLAGALGTSGSRLLEGVDDKAIEELQQNT